MAAKKPTGDDADSTSIIYTVYGVNVLNYMTVKLNRTWMHSKTFPRHIGLKQCEEGNYGKSQTRLHTIQLHIQK